MLITQSLPHDNGRLSSLIVDRLLNGVLVFLLIHALFAWFSHRYILGHDAQPTLCLKGNHRWYLIDRNERTPELGDLVAYRSNAQMAPEIPVGTLVVKRVEGLPGDLVNLAPQGLSIQGEMRPARYPHRARLMERSLPAGSHLVIPENSLWVMGDHPRSLDSRYFGPIQDREIIGVAHALPF